MAAEEWFLQEEGRLQFSGRPTSISYSPTSHCFLATLDDGSVEVLDVSSGRTLKRTFLEGSTSTDSGILECRFCPGVEKLFITDGRTVGLRKDLNGVLLLDSILQAPVPEDCDTPIALELTLVDAKHLQSGIEVCLPSVVPPVLDVMETLKEQLREEVGKYQVTTSSDTPSSASSIAPSVSIPAISTEESDKAAKWVTCKLCLPAGALLCAFDGMVTFLHKSYKTSAALPIASAMLSRVMSLTGTSVLEKKGQPVYKQLMFVEASRRQTFSTWPHMDYKWAYPEAMAQAGFYHQPSCSGDDRAMCFTCSVCLVCWEPTDEPWSEHERHSAECPYVKGERTENVPMSVSLATTPAKHHDSMKRSKIVCVSASSCSCLMATSSDAGHIVVWDLSDQLKVYSQFMVNASSKYSEKDNQLDDIKQTIQVSEAWAEFNQGFQAIPNHDSAAEPTPGGDSLADPLPVVIEPVEHDDVDKSSEGLVEEPKQPEMDCTEHASEGLESPPESPTQPQPPSVSVTALSLVCQPDQDHQHVKRLHTAEHKPVLIAGMSHCQHNQEYSSSDSIPSPHLVLYNASSEKASFSNGKLKNVSKPKPEPKISQAQQLGSQEDLYSVLSSEDEIDQELIPVVLPDAIQSSTLKKLAMAITGNTFEKEEEASKMKQENIIQTLPLPSEINETNSIISQIIPCAAGWHVLVVVHRNEVRTSRTEVSSQGDTPDYCQCSGDKENTSTQERSNESQNGVSICVKTILGCSLVLYRLQWTSDNTLALSDPIAHCKLSADDSLSNVISLPVDNAENVNPKEFPMNSMETNVPTDALMCGGRFAGVTQDGSIVIIDAHSLSMLTKFSPHGKGAHKDEQFNDIVFCPGIDCVCCSTGKGALHFLSLMRKDDTLDPGIPLGQNSQGVLGSADVLLELLGISDDITVDSLRSLLKLTKFENLVPRFTAIVPPCWSEVQQEQQQRRHPQHLHQQTLGDSTLHTRTWKLQPEAKNHLNDEQIFELLLPKQCHVGHVDIKFSLHSSSTTPCMKVYLLKPWSLKSWQQEYSSETEKDGTHEKLPIIAAARESGHILCGPVELETGQHSRVVLTCPDLIKSRHRILLLVFEASHSQVHLEEISVTIRRFKYCPQPSHLKQYAAMLEEPAFHRRLLDIVCSCHDGETKIGEARKLALDLLCWIAGICLHTPTRKESLIHHVQDSLGQIIPACYLYSGRTIAHKCSLLLLLCARHCQWTSKHGSVEREVHFKTSLLQVILRVLPDVTSGRSAGALHWLFCMLVGYAAQADIKQTSRVCQELLTEMSSKFASLMLYPHCILQSRYGLYGCPLDPTLFDLTVDPVNQPPAPRTTTSMSTTAAMTGTHSLPVWGCPALKQPDDSSVVTGKSTVTTTTATGLQDLESSVDSLQYMASLIAHQGLLEVEPLHFACSSTSDGARVERMESPPSVPVGGLSAAATATAISTATGHAFFGSLPPSVPLSSEPDLEYLTQHYQQLAKLQQHKKELEKHKQELEELAVWSLFPKVLSKLEAEDAKSLDPVGMESWPLPGGGITPNPHFLGDSVNLALQKKLANRRAAAKKGGSPSLGPIHRQLSQLPLPQVLIIERLHSGARHHVILDFGTVVDLTDIVVPRCTDLSSLSIDVWTEGEEKDAQRIAIVSDIGTCDCVLKDVTPPPVCQYVKLTVVGRPRSNAKVRMKIGEFFGRPVTHSITEAHEEPDTHRLHLLANLYEEVHCHYSLACSNLDTLLQEASEKTQVQKVYQQCNNLQLQLNVIQQAIERLHVAPGSSCKNASFDQLRVICTCLAETLVALTAISPVDNSFLVKTVLPTGPQHQLSMIPLDLCEVLFRNLCVLGSPVLRVRVAAILLHTSGTQPWWGDFLAKALKEFFSSSQQMLFPQQRVFVVLAVLAQQSPDITSTLNSLLHLLDTVLSAPGTGKTGQVDIHVCHIDLPLVGWILLLLAHILDTFGVGKTSGSNSASSGEGTCVPGNASSRMTSNGHTSSETGKWDFIVPPPTTQITPQSTSLTGYRQQRHKLRRQIMLHEKQLHELQKQQKKVMEVESMQPSDVQHFQQAYLKSKFTSQALKHIKDLVKLRRQESEPSSSKKNSDSSKGGTSSNTDNGFSSVPLLLPQSTTVPVMKKMLGLLLNMDSSCSVDLLLTMCKAIAHLSCISQPAVLLTDVLSDEQVETILRLCVSNWGGAWARHALITLLQDLMHGGKYFGETLKEDDEVKLIDKESEVEEMECRTDVNSSEPAEQTMVPPGIQELWTVEILPGDDSMEWLTEAEIPVPIEFPGYDTPPPLPAVPTSVTSTLIIPPKPAPTTDPPDHPPLIKLSSAIDARLELGVEMEAEWDLKILQFTRADAILKGMSAQVPSSGSSKLSRRQPMASPENVTLVFSKCFNKLFSECRNTNLELSLLLELWLRLNAFLPRDIRNPQSTIVLHESSMCSLLSCLSRSTTISLQTLYLAFEVMRDVLGKSVASDAATDSLLNTFITNPDLLDVLQKTLLEGSPRDYGTDIGVGTSGTGIKQVEVFLSSLAVAVEKRQDSRLSSKFHNLLLDLLCTLATEKVQSSGKPVQMKPILRVLIKHPPPCTKHLDTALILRLLHLTMLLSLQHLRRKEDMSLTASNHFHETPRLTTTSASHFLDGKTMNGPWIVHSTWLTKLLSLVIILVQLPGQPVKSNLPEGTPSGAKAVGDEAGVTTLKVTNNMTGESSIDGTSDDASESDFKEREAQAMNKTTSHNTTKKSSSQESIHVLGVASDSLFKTLQALAKAVEDETSQASGSASGEPSLEQKEEISLSSSPSETSSEETSQATGEATENGSSLEKEHLTSAGKVPSGNDPSYGISESINSENKVPHCASARTSVPKQGAQQMRKSDLPDIIIKDDQICLNLLHCLNLSNSNNIGVLLTGASMANCKGAGEEVSVSGDPVSVEDGVLQIASVIQSQLSNKSLLIATVLKFLGETSEGPRSSATDPVVNLSEPFLWFLFRMLDSEDQVTMFIAKDGYKVVFKNLVASHSVQLDQNTQELIPVMRQLTKRSGKVTTGNAKPLLTAIWDAEKDKGMVNYAPFGTIGCSRPSSHPPDNLLKATAPHRRARSAAWSYHFYPGELWCDLTIHLPTPVLIHEVHVQPHTAGLTTCPSYVALDYSVDGTVMVPASKPVMTSGLSVIKLQFQQPQVAQHVCVRCRRPRDSETLGLSQIKIWGTTLYGPTDERSSSSDQGTQMDCLNWVRLLHHCLQRTPLDNMSTVSSSSLLQEVFGVCISMLASPRSDLFTGCQEAVVLRLALHCSDLNQILLTHLLANPDKTQVCRSSSVSPSSVQLIYELGKTNDKASRQRLSILAGWLSSLATVSHLSTTTEHGLTGHIQAICAVLWTTADTHLARVVHDEFKEPLFRSIYEWSQLVRKQDILKQTIDLLLCSLCHVCPTYFQLLLHLTDAQTLVDLARTQDNHSNVSFLAFVTSESNMSTLSRASQSPITAQLLLESGLLNVLHNAITHLCNSLLKSDASKEAMNGVIPLSLDCLAEVLAFLAQCAEEPIIKDWFGESGKAFWRPLLLVLGSGELFNPTSTIIHHNMHVKATRHRMAIESAAIRFFSQCIASHPGNQKLFAKLLCNVMETPCRMSSITSGNPQGVATDTKGTGLSGFLRRLVLEVLLQDERINVCIHSESSLTFSPRQEKTFCHSREWHPRYGAGHKVAIVKAKLTSTVSDLDMQVLPQNKSPEPSGSEEDLKNGKLGEMEEFPQFGDSDILEGLSIAAGINVKFKRDKSGSMLKRISNEKIESNVLRPCPSLPMCRHNVLLGNSSIPSNLTLSQLLNTLMSRGLPAGNNCIELSLKNCGALTAHMPDDQLTEATPLPTALHIFASYRGLAILSSRLSCAVVMNQPESPSGASPEADHPVSLGFPLPLFSLSPSVLSRIPGHSLAAFGLFICLPGYAEVLLQDRPRAQCLLRLLLGAEDDGNGGNVLSSRVACCLPTLPFQILRLLFHSTPLSSDIGVSLRESSYRQGALQLVLVCLGVLSHHQPRVVSQTDRVAIQTVAALTGNLLRGLDQNATGEKQYWAKGTGFGTGSTTSDWDVENAMKKQRAEESHVTCMLQVLAAYIRPSGAHKMEDLSTPDYSQEYVRSDRIHESVAELLSRSCLVPALSSYLRNDSVLDMARHVPLYQSLLEVLRALATCPSLVHLLTPESSGSPLEDTSSLAALIGKMKHCVDTYCKTLRSTSGANRKSKRENPVTKAVDANEKPRQQKLLSMQPIKDSEDDDGEADAEGLALLIPDIQATAKLVHTVLSKRSDSSKGKGEKGEMQLCCLDGTVQLSNEERYLATMRPLQFDMHEIVREEGNKLEFNISYHFASALRSAASTGDPCSPARARRLAQEISSLSTSLPLSSSSSVFVRCDEDRLDVMKVLITGPSETPYANGCFEFDVYFPQNYPDSPMQINFETTGHHTVRFNPNLYNDGKVCLSILNTWHGRPEEKWNAQTSSFLQVLVSTQSLILVSEPYFNEPGYERSRGTPAGQQNSQEYNANIRQASVKWGMLEQLRKPSACFQEVIQSHFYLKKDEVVQQCEKWIREVEALTLRTSGGRAVTHHFHSLKQSTAQLRQELNKLQPPNQIKSDEDSE